jgi:translation initiation factor IF-3
MRNWKSSTTPSYSSVNIIQNTSLYRRTRKRKEEKKRTERIVKDKEMHMRNIENGDFSIEKISCYIFS